MQAMKKLSLNSTTRKIEAEPAHRIAGAEMGVVDDGVMQQHQQNDDGTRAIECDDLVTGPACLIASAGPAGHFNASVHAVPALNFHAHFSNAS